MATLEKKITTVDVVQPDGSINVVEQTITFGKVKKCVLARQNLTPFGSIAYEEFSKATEKPIEIRCLPPVAVQQIAEDIMMVQNEPAMLEQLPTAPRCKHCGMEGHLSLKCPKRKEIEVKVKPEEKEVTVLLSDISDMTNRDDIFALVDETAYRVNQQLSKQLGQNYSPISSRSIKSTLPLTADGSGHRGIAYVNIQWTPSADAFAAGLAEELDGAKVGMVLIRAQINVSTKQRRQGPNRYDDEEKWGHNAGRR